MSGPVKVSTLRRLGARQFYRVGSKTFETLIFNINGDGLPDPLIIGTFEKQVPGLYQNLKKQ